MECDIEKLIVPSCVKTLDEYAFQGCEQLREVVFEPGSHLETIGYSCFGKCGITSIVIPKSVHCIGTLAFHDCERLGSLSFEEGCQLTGIGRGVFYHALLK